MVANIYASCFKGTTLNESIIKPQHTPAVQQRIQRLNEELDQVDRREAEGQLSHNVAERERHRIRYRINRWIKHHPRAVKRKVNRRTYKQQQTDNAMANWKRAKTDRSVK